MTLPLAHVGHYLWVFYLLPVIFVVLGILKTILGERRRKEDVPPGGGTGVGPRTDPPDRPQDPPP
jgi:cytochrome c-type biogenesis protein CcmH/NrfF